MPLLDPPKYPVVDANPSWGRVISNFNINDVCAMVSLPALGYASAFFGSSLKLRAHNARFTGGIGLMAGLMFASMSSTQRLLGLEENKAEVQRFGVLSNAEREMATARLLQGPNVDLIDDGTNSTRR
jgi:hypothetical protein